MKNLKVKNIENNGRNVPNQFLISYEENGKNYEVFQSYSSMILMNLSITKILKHI